MSALLAAIGLPAFGSTAGRAQTTTADSGIGLLQPSLDGNPATPPTFKRPGPAQGQQSAQALPTETFSPPSTLGATPIYGSPTGFGAGDTGYDSSNRPKGKRQAQPAGGSTTIAPPVPMTFDPLPPPPLQVSSQPPIVPPPLRPEIYPARAATRPGAALPPPPDQLPISNPPPEVHPVTAATRPGAVLPLPPPPLDVPASTPPPGTPQPNTLPLGTVPQHTLPIAAGDPYEALGIKAGSFLILPAVELSTGYDTNPARVAGGPGSLYFVVAPELHVRSDWSSNALTADIVGSYTDYDTNALTPSQNHPYLNAKVDGRLDVTRDTQILLENRVIVSTDNPGSPNIQAGLSKLPIDTTVGGTFGVAQQWSRFGVLLRGTIDRSTYQNSELTDGESVSNADRNFNQYGGILRLSYDLNPGFRPFVELSADTRVHDLATDTYGEDRNSNGTSGKVGGDFNLFGSLTGEMAIGYMVRDYHDPTLPNIAGTTFDGALIWQATALTTAKLTATSTVTESVLQGVSGEFSRDLSLEVDHALRTWLIANVQGGYGYDEYVGMPRDDNRWFAAAGLTYKLNREMQLKGELRHDWLTSTMPGVANQSTSVLLTMRLQR